MSRRRTRASACDAIPVIRGPERSELRSLVSPNHTSLEEAHAFRKCGSRFGETIAPKTAGEGDPGKWPLSGDAVHVSDCF